MQVLSSFISYVFVFLGAFFGLCLIPNHRSYNFLNAFCLFILRVIIKDLISYSELELQFFASVFLLVILLSFIQFYHFVLVRRVPFNISYVTGLVVVNSFIFYLSGKAFISPSYLEDNFLDILILAGELSLSIF